MLQPQQASKCVDPGPTGDSTTTVQERLEQAITLWWMLGMMGIGSTIRLGIYKSGESVEAHAWVLHEEKIVIGLMDDQKEFTPLLDVNFERQQ